MKKTGPGFIAIGLVFLIIGFVRQEFSINFESGFFILGLIFTISGLAAYVLSKRSKKDR